MARNTSYTNNNKLKIHDNMSDSDIVLFYRHPTTKQRQAYQNMAIQRRRNKVVMQQAEARLKFGLDILTGIRDGDFVRDLPDGRKNVPYSSDPSSPDYLESWKGEVEKGAADLVMLLAAYVFDASAEIDAPDDAEDTPALPDEDADPNSGKTSPH